PGANTTLSQGDIDHALPAIQRSAVVVLQLEIPLAVVEYAMQAARDAGVTVILNPAPAARLEIPFLRMCNILVPNRVEVGRLAGVGPPTEAATGARMLVSSGIPAVIVTLGEDGAVIVTRQEETAVPAFAVSAIDTTGAGDAFVGNLAHGVAA